MEKNVVITKEDASLIASCLEADLLFIEKQHDKILSKERCLLKENKTKSTYLENIRKEYTKAYQQKRNILLRCLKVLRE